MFLPASSSRRKVEVETDPLNSLRRDMPGDKLCMNYESDSPANPDYAKETDEQVEPAKDALDVIDSCNFPIGKISFHSTQTINTSFPSETMESTPVRYVSSHALDPWNLHGPCHELTETLLAVSSAPSSSSTPQTFTFQATINNFLAQQLQTTDAHVIEIFSILLLFIINILACKLAPSTDAGSSLRFAIMVFSLLFFGWVSLFFLIFFFTLEWYLGCD